MIEMLEGVGEIGVAAAGKEMEEKLEHGVLGQKQRNDGGDDGHLR